MFGKMILPHLKSSIPAGFCKLAGELFKESSVYLVSIIFRIRTRKCTKLFMENIKKYFVHAQAVCTRSILRGGSGDEAMCTQIYRSTLGKQLEDYEAPQRKLHINMSVPLRLLVDFEE